MMLVSRANITGLVDRLERDGLVYREADPRDRRSLRAKITAQGGKPAAKGGPSPRGVHRQGIVGAGPAG